jgi:phospholipid/cholesterol/gamma-HCH transport system substrate-binding protein
MEKTTGNKTRLGLFVFTSLILFITAIYFIGKKQQMFGSTFLVCGIFKDINGLQIGNNVRFSGINVGVIDDIEQITDSTVRVDMLIDEQARKFMKKNVKGIIGSDGLMGNKIIIIIPGSTGQKQLADKDFIETAQPISMDDIMLKVKITSDNAAIITRDLSAIIGNISNGKGTIGKLFMDTVFAKNLDKTLINIKQGAGGFEKNMDAASHNFLLRRFFKKKEKKREEETK